MKRRWKLITAIALPIILILAISGTVFAAGPWWKADPVPAPSSTSVAGSISAPATASTLAPSTAALAPLSETEKQALLFLREEEKLAHDVYVALYSKWGVSMLNTISASESKHMESVRTLLIRYGLTDPVAVSTPGVFVNTELQAAYTQLVAQGTQSREAAFGVGVTIENLDIEDLQALLAISTHADIKQVAQSLLSASENHLRSFNRQLGN